MKRSTRAMHRAQLYLGRRPYHEGMGGENVEMMEEIPIKCRDAAKMEQPR